MNDKKPLVAHRQYGKDEDSTQALIKKQEAIELEIDGYSVKVADLEAESQRMLSKEHFDSDTIRERQVTQHMQASFDGLNQLLTDSRLNAVSLCERKISY